jgi:hypothetical protein
MDAGLPAMAHVDWIIDLEPHAFHGERDYAIRHATAAA